MVAVTSIQLWTNFSLVFLILYFTRPFSLSFTRIFFTSLWFFDFWTVVRTFACSCRAGCVRFFPFCSLSLSRHYFHSGPRECHTIYSLHTMYCFILLSFFCLMFLSLVLCMTLRRLQTEQQQILSRKRSNRIASNFKHLTLITNC